MAAGGGTLAMAMVAPGWERVKKKALGC